MPFRYMRLILVFGLPEVLSEKKGVAFYFDFLTYGAYQCTCTAAHLRPLYLDKIKPNFDNKEELKKTILRG
jgi:CRISPR/Cas system-associated protein endoribonuclease Cas2